MNKLLRRENIEKHGEKRFSGENKVFSAERRKKDPVKFANRVPNQKKKKGEGRGKTNTKLFRGKRERFAILPLSISISPFPLIERENRERSFNFALDQLHQRVFPRTRSPG